MRLASSAKMTSRTQWSASTCQSAPARVPSCYGLERCAELLGVDVATVREPAAKVEPYLRADGTRIWSLMLLEWQLDPRPMAGAGAATSTADRAQPPTHSQSGMPQAPLGYESFERRSRQCCLVPRPWADEGAAASPPVSVPAHPRVSRQVW
jgi:hypothetical protein